MTSKVQKKNNEYVVPVDQDIRWEIDASLESAIDSLKSLQEYIIDGYIDIYAEDGMYGSGPSVCIDLQGFRKATEAEIKQYEKERKIADDRQRKQLANEREQKKLKKINDDQKALDRAMKAFPEKFKDAK